VFKKYISFVLFMALSAIVTACGAAAPASSGPNVTIEGPYARAGMPNGAVYMELKNDGGAADAVLSADSDVADAVELHESKMEGDVMKMSPIEKIEVPAGGATTLKPGGIHVMLIGLKGDLAVGDTFQLTLNFENSGAKTIDVEVKEAMQMPANMEMDHGGEMDGEMDGEMEGEMDSN
jgi:copper(I)-binding protein